MAALCLQTAKGKVAKAVVASEFKDVMVQKFSPWMKDVVSKKLKGRANNWAKVRLYLDNATWHSKAVKDGMLTSMGLEKSQLVEHPPGSHDLNKPIENAHGLVKRAFREWLYGYSGKLTPLVVKRKFTQLWVKLVTPQYVRKCFESLPKVYQRVLAADGDWGSRRD